MAGFTGSFKMTSYGLKTFVPTKDGGLTTVFLCQIAEVVDENDPRKRGDDEHGLILNLEIWGNHNGADFSKFTLALINLNNPLPGKNVEDIALPRIQSGEWKVRASDGNIAVL